MAGPTTGARERLATYLGRRRKPVPRLTRRQIVRRGVLSGVLFGAWMVLFNLVLDGFRPVSVVLFALSGVFFGWFTYRSALGQQHAHFGGPLPDERT